MEILAAFWNFAPLWAALIAIIVIAVVIARVRRSRTASVTARRPLPALPPETEANPVDSSHVGFAPMVSSALQQAPFGADAVARDEEPGGGRH
ncbi:MAG TPA: hypothetical protein VG429_01195 [Casimicrobiaceae bacterium]|nr:hypothetical protein [Casimicrobiaceae bacterium]